MVDSNGETNGFTSNNGEPQIMVDSKLNQWFINETMVNLNDG